MVFAEPMSSARMQLYPEAWRQSSQLSPASWYDLSRSDGLCSKRVAAVADVTTECWRRWMPPSGGEEEEEEEEDDEFFEFFDFLLLLRLRDMSMRLFGFWSGLWARSGRTAMLLLPVKRDGVPPTALAAAPEADEDEDADEEEDDTSPAWLEAKNVVCRAF